jgi:hypothetical protein
MLACTKQACDKSKYIVASTSSNCTTAVYREMSSTKNNMTSSSVLNQLTQEESEEDTKMPIHSRGCGFNAHGQVNGRKWKESKDAQKLIKVPNFNMLSQVVLAKWAYTISE